MTCQTPASLSLVAASAGDGADTAIAPNTVIAARTLLLNRLMVPSRVAVIGSLALHVGRLDDRPPFLDLGLLIRGQRRGRLLVGRRDLLAEIGEFLAHLRVGQRVHDGGVEPPLDLRGRA